MDTTVSESQEQENEANAAQDGLESRIEELRRRLVSLNERTKGFIKEHPAACLTGALGLGYLFARIARRRS